MMRRAIEHPFLSAKKALGLAETSNPNRFLMAAVEKIVGIEKLNQLLSEAGPPWPDANTLIDFMFSRLDIKWSVENSGILENLDERPKVFVANHPYGLPDAFALFQLLTRYRPNVKLFANKILAASELKEDRLLHVDPFMDEGNRGLNRKSVATALKHLRDGGDLALFPGRLCSHLKTSDWMISDSEWTDQIIRFVEVSDGDMVPMFISGRNSLMFNLSGLIHPKIRTYMLLREFLRGGHDFRFQIGEPVPADQLAKVSRSISPGTFSRSLTYALKTGAPEVPGLAHLVQPKHRIAQEISQARQTATAISGLPVRKLLAKHQLLLRKADFSVFQIGAGISEAMLDIICEVRFAAYSGSGIQVDSPDALRDHFDKLYSHLILWDEKNQIVAGVYRYVLPDPASLPVSRENLVTSTIFDLQPAFKKLLPKSMELGRVAILPEYQRNHSTLMLLWHGILEIPRQDPNIKYLFGPVSMGRAFSPVSRELLHRFIVRDYYDDNLRGFARPKLALDLEIPKEVDLEKIMKSCGSFSELSSIINGFESGKRTLPVLFRSYANVGCRYISFGEWKNLDYATTGLTVLDLKNMSRSFLSRFFGKQGMEEFLLGR